MYASLSPARRVLSAQRILELNLSKGFSDQTTPRMLRLSVEPGGCSGFQYGKLRGRPPPRFQYGRMPSPPNPAVRES